MSTDIGISMGADRKKDWQIRLKKLALSYETGWEYLPESKEAGSVLTDIFLDMELENQKRFDRIWEKQERAFLSAVPETKEEPGRLQTALWVKATGENDGQWIEADTRAYTVTGQGALVGFRTVFPLRLTAAGLRWIIRRRGLLTWLCYQEGDAFPVSLSLSPDRVLARPMFRWRFRRLCDGHASFLYTVEFREGASPETKPPGTWTISDGRNSYPAVWQQSSGGASLAGECPGFAGNLEGEVYELRLELSAEETLPEEWLKALTGHIILREEAASLEPELCLTETGPGGSDRVLPFGREPETASCFYLACDRAAAGASGELTLQLTEEYETEEKNPEPEPKEYRKLYKKYPWLRQTEQVQEWRAEETLWEYFNGRMWRALPGSGDWNTGCGLEEPGERQYRFFIPEDISPCSVEGEEHLYLRLRVAGVRGAYSPYYRKQIPVLKGIRFLTQGHMFEPEERETPDICEAGKESVYLGFDREVLPDNCWYNGKDPIRFGPEQIKGQGERYGKKAYWIEMSVEEEELAAFLPNHTAVRQDGAETTEAGPEQFPEGTVFYVETGKMGVLDGVSVSGAQYDREGAPIRDERETAAHFFSHYGRLLTVTDLELLLQERYPFFAVETYAFCGEKDEPEIRVVMVSRTEEGTEGRLQEVSGWLSTTLRRLGPPWLQKAKVKCSLSDGTVSDGKAQRKQGRQEVDDGAVGIR
ncbi:MAG: hypothetical protein NC517_06230 [Firmicutes bacterium]|nr:hypothetical protein [Bacillota bacterium]